MIISDSGLIIESTGNPGQVQEQYLSYGHQLAALKDRVIFNGNGKYPNQTMGSILEGLEPGSMTEANTAILIENTRKFIDNMSETTKMVHIGDFHRFAFDMVKALFPALALNEIASVQPMPGPSSQLFYQKFVYGTTKGSATAGQDIIENPNEDYGSEVIDAEQLGTGDGATANYTGNLSWLPVQPGTIQITSTVSSAVVTVYDDGNGAFTGDVNGGGTNTIDYSTGAYNFTFSGNVDSGVAVNAEYQFDSEANDSVADIDMVLTSSTVEATPTKLRTRWSEEVAQDLKAVYGMSAEIEQVAGTTAELKFEIDRKGIRDMKTIANLSKAAWSRTCSPATISYTEHKLSFNDHLNQMSNQIFSATQRALGTWIVAGVTVCDILETMPQFVSYPKPPNHRGIYKAGRFSDKFDVWKDPTYPGSTRNSTDASAFMMGYRGQSMWEVGYIFAPYILMHTTATTQLDDFINRKGIMSRSGKKAVNGDFYCTSSVSA